jgi:hypothetical protein
MADEHAHDQMALPSYRAVVVVDMENYSGHRGAEHPKLTEMIPLVLERTLDRAGFKALWEERLFPDSTGDGYAVGFPAERLPVLVGPFLDALQDELAYQDGMLRTLGRDVRMRMRVAVSVGPLHEDHPDAPGTGDTRVEAHRLVDAHALRSLLSESDPNLTFVAAIVSERVFDDVVAAGYGSKQPSDFVRTDVEVKKYRKPAYLHVPKASGRLLSNGFAPAQEEALPPRLADLAEYTEARRGSTTTNTFTGNASGTVVQAGSIGRMNSDDDNRIDQRVRGRHNTVVGRDLNGKDVRKDSR